MKNIGTKLSLAGSLLAAFLLATTPTVEAKAPEIRLLVAQYANSVDFVMPHGGVWQLGNASSGEIKPGVVYRITGKVSMPARIKYHIMVKTVDLMDETGLVDAMEEYKKMGFQTHAISVGEAPKAIGMPDNRVVHLGINVFDDKEKAEQYKSELAGKGIKSWIYYENISKADGSLTLSSKGENIGGSFGGGDEGFTLRSKDGTILKNVEHSKGYSWHGFDNRTYLGKLRIGFGMDDCLDCVEYTDLEEMLVGVVPSEISPKANQAAMEAQAVAARGEIMSKKGLRHVNSGYDYCCEQHCQVYKGYQQISTTVAGKIRNTIGKVLMMKDSNKILDAVYSSNCGGHTSASHNIWIGEANPHLMGVSDEKAPKVRDLTNEVIIKDFILNPPVSWCGMEGYEGANKYRWEKKLSAEEWGKALKKLDIGKLKSAEILKRDVSGRVCTMKLTGTLGTKTLISELEIRQTFGGLKSSCFVVSWTTDKKTGFITGAKFNGAGFGHGVGMCQTGAQAMGGSGYTYEMILEHYFPEARLIPLYQ